MTASAIVIHDWRNNLKRNSALLPSKQYQDMTISAGAFGLLTALLMFFETAIYIYSDDGDEDDF